MKFSNNNNVSFVIDLIFFYLNKNFYSYISFNLNLIFYKITRERLKTIKIKNIFSRIKKLLKYD